MSHDLSPSGSAHTTPVLGGVTRFYLNLFLISFLALFLELACIRWFGSTVIFLTFFTNLVLMACFLGLSVGCLAARARRDLMGAVIPLALVTMALAFALLWSYTKFPAIMVDVGRQNSPQQIYFGTESRGPDLSAFVIPLEVIAGVFFALISLIFVGVGQALGRAFNAISNIGAAYAVNLLGSLVGIASFGILAYLRTAPPVWFAVAAALALFFIERTDMRLVSLVASALLVAGLVLTAELPGLTSGNEAPTIWSPYYKIRFEPAAGTLYVNNIQHQVMADFARGGSIYQVPYLTNRQAGGAPFDDVLIIGAGSGNDVAASLAYDAKHVDAVEIDPVLNEIGRQNHPSHFGANPRATPHIDDGRSFVRSTGKKYDLIIYALVDSLVLHSGYSSIRLESFLFTEQAFRDLKDHLKPGGLVVIYNYYRQGWVVGRLSKLANKVFGAPPIVLSLPYQAEITARTSQGNRLSYVIAGTAESARLQAIRTKFHDDQFFWVHAKPSNNGRTNSFGTTPPLVNGTWPEEWYKVGPASVQTEGIGPLPSDDFPFLYLRDPVIPGLNLRGMLIVAALSLAMLFAFKPMRTSRPNGQMFFLGAGFMLLETKGVVHLALLFGSTWMVNSIVFAAILVMALLSNFYVMVRKPQSLVPYYILLVASLLLGLVVPMASFLALPGISRVLVSCLVVFVPIFFAGVVFASSFSASARPDVAFGSNIGGAILGGLSENLSLAVGFNNLLILAMAYYVVSALFARRLRNSA
jgi:spermidine synthase